MRPLTEVSFDGFVHVERGALVDGRGRPLLLRGVGLGGWLLVEGYMWRLPDAAGQSPRRIEAFLASILGDAAAERFWATYRERFVTEADIARIADLGFDHVRLPLNARLIEDGAGGLRPDGIAFVDRCLEWCRRHGLWVVLDLHGAPGGQTGTNIDDSPHERPDLFVVGGGYRDRTIGLWTSLARRYRDDPVVAAYDLLNEPLPNEWADRYPDALVSLYRDLTDAIRAVDQAHVLSYEGTRWATDWAVLRDVPDANALLQFHRYWAPPERSGIARYIDQGRELGLPIYMGEGGENDLDWLTAAFGLYEDEGISWNLWPWKKLRTWTSPVSVRPPSGWASLTRWAGGGIALPRPEAHDILAAFLDAIPLDACEERSEVVHAVLQMPPVRFPVERIRSEEGGSRRAVDATDAPMYGPVDAPDRAAPRFELLQPAGSGSTVRLRLETAARLRLDLEAPDGVATASVVTGLTVDGVAVDVQPGPDGAALETRAPVDAGVHEIRLQLGARRVTIRGLRVESLGVPHG